MKQKKTPIYITWNPIMAYNLHMRVKNTQMVTYPTYGSLRKLINSGFHK